MADVVSPTISLDYESRGECLEPTRRTAAAVYSDAADVYDNLREEDGEASEQAISTTSRGGTDKKVRIRMTQHAGNQRGRSSPAEIRLPLEVTTVIAQSRRKTP